MRFDAGVRVGVGGEPIDAVDRLEVGDCRAVDKALSVLPGECFLASRATLRRTMFSSPYSAGVMTSQRTSGALTRNQSLPPRDPASNVLGVPTTERLVGGRDPPPSFLPIPAQTAASTTIGGTANSFG